MMLGNFQCQGVILIWILVEQRHNVLAVGAVGMAWLFFL